MKEREVVIESILGHSSGTMSKARQAVTAFCCLVKTWAFGTNCLRAVDMGGEQQLSEYEDVLQKSHFYKLRRNVHCVEANYSSSSVIEPYLISVTLGTAEALVAHSCF